MTEIPFADRRSMRPIKNKFIILAEQAGHEDLNTWIDYLLEVQFREAKMSENIKALQAQLVKYEGKDDEQKVKKILDARPANKK